MQLTAIVRVTVRWLAILLFLRWTVCRWLVMLLRRKLAERRSRLQRYQKALLQVRDHLRAIQYQPMDDQRAALMSKTLEPCEQLIQTFDQESLLLEPASISIRQSDQHLRSITKELELASIPATYLNSTAFQSKMLSSGSQHPLTEQLGQLAGLRSEIRQLKSLLLTRKR